VHELIEVYNIEKKNCIYVELNSLTHETPDLKTIPRLACLGGYEIVDYVLFVYGVIFDHDKV